PCDPRRRSQFQHERPGGVRCASTDGARKRPPRPARRRPDPRRRRIRKAGGFMSRLVALAALVLFAFESPAAAASPAAVQAEIAHISQGIDGVVGVAAWRLDGKGPSVLVNADQLYPMASTFKVPIAG